MWLLRRSKTGRPWQSARRRCRPRYEVLEDRIDPATFQVADVTGLQTAIAAVNNNPTEQATIKLAPGTYDLTSELQIENASDLTIKGAGQDKVIIEDSAHAARIFDIDGGDVTIAGVTISGGRSRFDGGGIYNNGGTLTVRSSTLSGNTAPDGGGIANNGGTLTVSSSTFSGNTTDLVGGGGIFNKGGTLTVSSSTFSGNRSLEGGGIENIGGAR